MKGPSHTAFRDSGQFPVAMSHSEPHKHLSSQNMKGTYEAQRLQRSKS